MDLSTPLRCVMLSVSARYRGFPKRPAYICQPCYAFPFPFIHYRSQHMSVVFTLAAPFYSTLCCIASFLQLSLSSCYYAPSCILTMGYNTISISYYLLFLHTIRARSSAMESQSERDRHRCDGLLGDVGES